VLRHLLDELKSRFHDAGIKNSGCPKKIFSNNDLAHLGTARSGGSSHAQADCL
jgi:hypothetical protein